MCGDEDENEEDDDDDGQRRSRMMRMNEEEGDNDKYKVEEDGDQIYKTMYDKYMRKRKMVTRFIKQTTNKK